MKKEVLRSFIRLALCCALLMAGAQTWADTVYITGNVSNCPSGDLCKTLNTDMNPNTGYPVYDEHGLGAYTSAQSTAQGKPATVGARYFSTAVANTTFDNPAITLSPALGKPGGIYRIYHEFSSAAGNVNTNLILGVTNISGCTLSFTNTDKFQTQYGVKSGSFNVWQMLGYLTNDPGSSNPIIGLFYESGTVDAGAEQRLIIDTFRFVEYTPCLDVPTVSVTGPLSADVPNVPVSGVSSNATRVTVYQDKGSGMQLIGSTNVSNPTGIVNVAATGLVKGAQVAATQTLNNQEGCVPTTGLFVGGGANPSLRFAFSIRANPALEGPVGSTSGGTNSSIYFLGASSTLSHAAPEQGAILQPSTNWQTVTFTRGDPASPTDPFVVWNSGSGLAFEGNFGGLDGIAIASEGDPGPVQLYLDDLSNGTNGVIQGWENATNGAVAYQFQPPSFSGTTSGFLLADPNQSVVTSGVAASGNNSLRVRFEYNGLETNKWIRLVTAAVAAGFGVQNPQLDLNQPISIKVLLPPPGVNVERTPVQPPGPLSFSRSGNQLTLTWAGQFQLQSSSTATGPYADVQGATTGSYQTTMGGQSMFFRLRGANP